MAKKIKTSYQICVSGAAKGKSVEEGQELAFKAGVAIAGSGHMLLTGATTGLPHYAVLGAKSVGGKTVGISPASSKIAHTKKYNLPTEGYDVILYTGLHYVGRDALLISSSDAVVSIGGRIGTLHEFTVAMEMDKPIGFLMGAGGISEEIQGIMTAAGKRKDDDVIFDENPSEIVNRLVKLLDEDNHNYLELYDLSLKDL